MCDMGGGVPATGGALERGARGALERTRAGQGGQRDHA